MDIYSSERLILKNYIEHHGIKGQKWGVKNGPPYPLDAKGQLRKVHSLVDELNSKWDYGAIIDGKKGQTMKILIGLSIGQFQ